MTLLGRIATAFGLSSSTPMRGPVIRVAPVSRANQQAVIVHFNYGSTQFQPIFDLEAELDRVLSASGVGDLDGHKIATSGEEGYLYLYGRSADQVYDVVRPTLRKAAFILGAKVTKIYGELDSGARQVEMIVA